ncbi:MAG: hypothetical protein IJU52_00250 [Clostridia bacterium]|nr:hypothetical protein [Clostridia bacterium]
MDLLRFIKKDFGTVVKLWLNQFAMMFFGVLVLMPTANSRFEWLMPAASAFSVLFYFVLLFICSCDYGLKDNVRLESGREKFRWYKCTVLALTANALSIVASAVACISKLYIENIGYFESAKGATGAAASVYGVSTLINEILHVMYRGLFLFFKLDRIPFIYFFVVILSLAVCTLGYRLGTKGVFASVFARNEKRGR